MRDTLKIWSRRGVRLLIAGLMLGVATARAQPAALAEIPAVCEAGAAKGAGAAITLEELLALASEHNPDVAIARARVEAARGRFIQAGLYPNPTFIWEAEDVGQPGNAAPGNQGPIIGQTIVTAGKLKKAKAAASHGINAADWQAVTRWYDVVTRTRLAYYDVLAAQREVQTAEESVGVARKGLDAAEKLQSAGAGTRPDIIRAKVELDQNRVQFDVAHQRLDSVWELLKVAVGTPEIPCGPLAEILDIPPPVYDWHHLEKAVVETSVIQEAQAIVLQAEGLVRAAEAEKCPNISLQVRPIYSFPEHRNEVTVWLGSALPLYNRNQGNIVSAEADLARTRQEVRLAELRQIERLAGAFQRYQSARRQVDAYRQDILPGARESLRLVTLGYERGDPKYDYTTVLTSQRVLIQAKIVYVQSLRELWRSVAEIEGLIQSGENLPCLPPGPG